MNSTTTPTKNNSRKTIIGAIAAVAVTAAAVGGTIAISGAFDKNLACSDVCADNTPVCAQDGLWYANSCLATCAGARIARSTLVCASSPPVSAPTVDSVMLPKLTGRHAEKGYKFVGMLDNTATMPFDVVPGDSKFAPESANSAPGSLGDRKQAVLEEDVPGAWIVIDEDGAVFYKTESAEDVIAGSGFAAEADAQVGSFEGSPHGCNPRRENADTPVGTVVAEDSEASDSESVSESDAAAAGEETGDVAADEARRRLFVIGGHDSRVQVHNSQDAPYKYIGELLPLGCSGTLISPRHIVTAGHCLWARVSGQGMHNGHWRSSDYFYAGRTNGGNYIAQSKITRKIVHRQYRKMYEDEFDWDYGIAELQDPIGADIGWMGMKYDCSANPANFNMRMRLIGYPADKPLHTMWEDRCGNISAQCSWRSLVHTCDTAPGSSGSSMIEDGPIAENAAPMIRAIHVAGSPNINIATLVQKSMFSTVQQWRGNPTCPVPQAAKAAEATPAAEAASETSTRNLRSAFLPAH